MFMLKSLFGKVWNDPNSTEISQISGGSFYLIRPDSVKGARECIFNHAMAAVRRVLNHEHHFELVITRVYEEGEEQLLEEDDESDHERPFLIDEQLEFRSATFESEPTFVWRDPQSGEDHYEFVASGTNDPTMQFFQAAVFKAMFERKYMRSSEDATEAQLAEFIFTPAPSRQTMSRQVSGTSSRATPNLSTEPPPVKSDEILKHNELAELYYFDKELGEFVGDEFDPVHAQIVVIGSNYYLRALSRASGDAYFGHQITSELNFRGLVSKNSFNWNHGEQGDMDTFGLVFPNRDGFARFGEAFGVALWEINNGQPMSKLKPDEREYILSSTRDVEMKDIDEEDEDVDDMLAEVEEAEEEEHEEISEDEDEPMRFTGDSLNSQLSVGYKDGRAFVVRGNQIGVFDTSKDSLKFRATIKDVKTTKGKAFAPKKVMLHNQDASMILMNPNDPHSLFRMDLDRGQVVEEWKVHDDITVKEIAPDSKFAQTTGQQTLVGTSHNALFRIDPRVSGNKLVDGEFKQYTTKNAFSSMATTANGRLAVGSEKGDVRLFDAIGKNAKTALPQMGDPILGVDVSKDGRWLVATCKTYLLLLDTLIGEGRYKGQLGFDRSFPADAKPTPRRLQLKPEHVAYMGSQVSFSPAKFNSGPDQEETNIVTSSGQFVIAWNFAKVKKGRLDAYEIKQYADSVVQDAFRFGDDNNIIVALKDNVLMVDKKALKKPTRTSLSIQAPHRSSAGPPSGIVREW